MKHVPARKRKNVVKNIKQKENPVKNVRNLTNQVRQVIIAIFLFLFIQVSAQNRAVVQPKILIGTEMSFSYRSNEFFHGFNFSRISDHYSYGAGIKFGVKSTYFQSTIYPQLNLKFTYLPILQEDTDSKKIISFGPQFQLNRGIQRVLNFHSYTDLLVGYEFCFGGKFRFSHSFSFGPYFESFKDNQNKRNTISSLNYYLSFGLNYAFY